MMPRWQEGFEWHTPVTHGRIIPDMYVRIGSSPSKQAARPGGFLGRRRVALQTNSTISSQNNLVVGV